MKFQIMYVELKSGYTDNGPAFIGQAFFSKTGRSTYFNGLAFSKGSRYGGNYFEIMTGEYYWISGIKKRGTNRHWAGGGKIQIDRTVVNEYLGITGYTELPKDIFEIVELNNIPPVEATKEYLNQKFE
jgi:hypothetical protein